MTAEAGTIRSLAEWTANDANDFREEVNLKGYTRLGITISELILEGSRTQGFDEHELE